MKHSETVHLAISVPTAATATNPPNLLQRFEWNFHPQLFIELAVNLVPHASNCQNDRPSHLEQIPFIRP